jgi:putative ABC transport system ATP-binding protein
MLHELSYCTGQDYFIYQKAEANMSQDVSKPPTEKQSSLAEGTISLPSTAHSSTDEQTTSSPEEKLPTTPLPSPQPSAHQAQESQAEQTHKQTSPPLVVVRHLAKTYQIGKHIQVSALQDVSLTIQPREFVAVMGPSGSGKSTLMNILGCLDRPTSGEYRLNGHLISSLANDQLASIRNQMIGFVFQNFNLLGRADIRKNVELPMLYAGYSKKDREWRARRVLELVGLSSHLQHKPAELSGGQQQRVAIARALINGPLFLLADEPTGNLDSQTGTDIMNLLRALNERGLTIVLVTHDSNVASYAQRIVQFLDGRLISDEPVVHERQAVSAVH